VRQVRFCELVVGAFFTLSYCAAGYAGNGGAGAVVDAGGVG
jgi:hypothetical protein